MGSRGARHYYGEFAIDALKFKEEKLIRPIRNKDYIYDTYFSKFTINTCMLALDTSRIGGETSKVSLLI